MGVDYKFDLMLSEDGSGRGAALVAAVLKREEEQEQQQSNGSSWASTFFHLHMNSLLSFDKFFFGKNSLKMTACEIFEMNYFIVCI